MSTIGYALSAVLGVGIIVVGTRFFLVPHSAAAAYGVPVGREDEAANAYLSVKAVRDIASGLFVLLLVVTRQQHLLGWLMLAATIIPATDAAIVLRHHGTKAAAFGIHGATAAVMLVTVALLFW